MKKTLLIMASIFFFVSLISTNASAAQNLEKAILAGGCFWCMESDFQEIAGVKDVVSGYIGGEGKDPTYRNYGKKGHIEAVQITYDPSEITYKDILNLFWLRIDPTDGGGQFCDRGHAYTTVIFYSNDEQRNLAEQSKAGLDKSGELKGPVATEISKANGFYPAETYHQDYYKKNPLRYRLYRYNCGRDKRLKELWGKAPGHN